MRKKEMLSRDDEDWDDLYCCLQIEMTNLRNKWSRFINQCAKVDSGLVHQILFRKEAEQCSRWRNFCEDIDTLECKFYNTPHLKEYYPSFVKMYMQFLELQKVTFDDLFKGICYSHHLGGGYYEARFV